MRIRSSSVALAAATMLGAGVLSLAAPAAASTTHEPAAASALTAAASTVAADTWAPGTDYTSGSVVTFGGKRYMCVVSHTSLAGWEPPNAPALWLEIP
ncbi:hypothetical protein Ssi03_67500 [Sphaerisporangium siamense]|uniref:Chitin-binding type-3 domain-containing protein n=1 Tax=Sphaerisporangium siamense TaxID=795645 RepID=A0A7W7D5X7_9ACTN|nr:carbohydrate-binding protein [Sphaerisporangium siamense]MBB4700711.1 hypothetical protein [Sphaerisporangium siamense]GII88760.1 hypothetical protein Ssi03_67500 [Sphaerisporangium siamense]